MIMVGGSIAKLFSKIIDVFFAIEHIPIIGDVSYSIIRIFPLKAFDLTSLQHEPYCLKCQKRLTQIWEEYKAPVVVPKKTIGIVENYLKKYSGSFYPSDIAEELRMDYDITIAAVKQLATERKIAPIDRRRSHENYRSGHVL